MAVENEHDDAGRIEVGRAYDLCLTKLGKEPTRRTEAIESMYSMLARFGGQTADIHIYDLYMVASLDQGKYYVEMAPFQELLASLTPKLDSV